MKFTYLLFVSTILILTSCNNRNTRIEKGYIYIQKQSIPIDKWRLIWHEDFDADTINTTRWSRISPGKPDWRKHMTKDDICYEMKNGSIYLKGINNPDTTKDKRPFLTGGIYTKNKFAFQYGKIEIRAKLDCAKGAWPAIWLLAEQKKYGKYPRNGEIDIMEHLNFDDIIYQTTHSYYTLNLKQKNNPPHHGTAKLDISKFNTYGLNWYPDKLVFTLNGKPTFTYPKVEGADKSQWPYDQPFYVLIDQQLGGSWVGDVKSEDLPVNMIVDWVKVYQ